MGLRHAVVTSVNRDDQLDGGAAIFAATIAEIRARVPGCAVEVLIPDFKGRWEALQVVLDARPDVLNHNVETVPRLYRTVRSGAGFERSLELLRRSTPAGTPDQERDHGRPRRRSGRAARDDRSDPCAPAREILTVGQYLRPSPKHLPVRRYYTPQEFEELRAFALGLGYSHVESGPLVRSSYHAESHLGG